MKNKKGAELSVNVIIVAVIALLVLVVLFAIFTGRMSIFSSSIGSDKACSQRGGTCTPVVNGGDTCGPGKTGLPGICTTKDNLCCISTSSN